MIKVDHVEVFNIHGAIRGMRNPMNSWGKSDTYGDKIGDNDIILATRLITAGAEHRKFLRQIIVSADITAPLYWWKEFDTYKVGTTANSCSTMHKLAERPLHLTDFSHEWLDEKGKTFLVDIIKTINSTMEIYKKNKNRTAFLAMVELLPSSYNQKRTITMNYENVLNILLQRSRHKLPEWRDLCDVFRRDLPYIEYFESFAEKVIKNS